MQERDMNKIHMVITTNFGILQTRSCEFKEQFILREKVGQLITIVKWKHAKVDLTFCLAKTLLKLFI